MDKTIARNVTEIINDVDLDFQLIATEMDTSVADMLYITEKNCYGTENGVEQFKKLVDDIRNVNGVEVTSFDDNTALYEYFNEAVILNTVFGENTLFFDSMVAGLIEERLAYFNE